MRFDQFEKASTEELRKEAYAALELADKTFAGHPGYDASLTAARFWIDEIKRRDDDKISRRDFRMELVVIWLIALELLVTVGLAVYGWHEESKEVDRQVSAIGQVQTALATLNTSSQSTAKTLAALQSTTETMSGAMQKQVGLFYDVEINAIYDDSTKRLLLSNNGRTNVSLFGGKFDNQKLEMLPKAQIIPPNGSFFVSIELIQKGLAGSLPKGASQEVPMWFLVTNEKNERFTVRGSLFALWQNDNLTFTVHLTELVPGWDKN